MTRRVYVSGAATQRALDGVLEHLRGLGVDPVAPVVDRSVPPESWVHHMRASVALLLTCSQVVMVPGWQRFKGSSIECQIAHDLEIPLIPLNEFGSTKS